MLTGTIIGANRKSTHPPPLETAGIGARDPVGDVAQDYVTQI